MEETRNLVLEIANRLYDLDAEVYRVLGSGLGRVFNASREESIRELTQIMKEHRTSHYLHARPDPASSNGHMTRHACS